jgi:hypothetical protein
MSWRRADEDADALWKSQLSLALGKSQGFGARLIVLGEMLLEVADSPLGRLITASLAVTGAWLVL